MPLHTTTIWADVDAPQQIRACRFDRSQSFTSMAGSSELSSLVDRLISHDDDTAAECLIKLVAASPTLAWCCLQCGVLPALLARRLPNARRLLAMLAIASPRTAGRDMAWYAALRTSASVEDCEMALWLVESAREREPKTKAPTIWSPSLSHGLMVWRLLLDLHRVHRRRMVERWCAARGRLRGSGGARYGASTSALRRLLLFAGGDDACRIACAQGGAVPALVPLLSSKSGIEAELAAEALGCAALSRPLPESAFVSSGAVPPLVRLLSSTKGSEAEVAAWAVGVIVACGDVCSTACVDAGALPPLVVLLSSVHIHTAANAAGALISIASANAAGKAACVAAGVGPALRAAVTRNVPDALLAFHEVSK